MITFFNKSKSLQPPAEGFTLIEIIISIVLMGIILGTLALGYRQLVKAIFVNQDISEAICLSRMEMAMIDNLNYSDATLAHGYDNITANYNSSGYDLNRSVSYAAGNDASAESLKKITVKIVPSGGSFTSDVLITSIIYRAKNVTIGGGSGGGGGATEANNLNFSSPTFSSRKILNFTLENQAASNSITITHVYVDWSPVSGNTLNRIRLFNSWVLSSGTYSSGTTFDVVDTIISASASSSQNQLTFNNNFPSSTTITFNINFTMSDGSTKEVSTSAST